MNTYELLRDTDNLCHCLLQQAPLALPRTQEAYQISNLLRKMTANPKGLTFETAMRQATEPLNLAGRMMGPNGSGHAAECVTTNHITNLHMGDDHCIINPFEHPAKNFSKAVISPNISDKTDFYYQFRSEEGFVVTRPGGQVGIGDKYYVFQKFLNLAKTKGPGQVGHVDSRYVNPDGSARAASNGFTPSQAKALNDAGVKFYGYKDLEPQARALHKNAKLYLKDGLTPLEREFVREQKQQVRQFEQEQQKLQAQQLEHARNEAIQHYKLKTVANRALTNTAISVGVTVGLSMIGKLLKKEEIKKEDLAKTAAVTATYSVGTTVVEAAAYKVALKSLAPELAMGAAKKFVTGLGGVISIGFDVVSDVNACRKNEITSHSAAIQVMGKVGLTIGCMALTAPLGPVAFVAIPVIQSVGRWLLGFIRND